MSTATREERLARRVADLYATDEQFANARPSEAVTAATEQPGLRLPQIVHTVMEAYAERQGVHETRGCFTNHFEPEVDDVLAGVEPCDPDGCPMCNPSRRS